MLIRKHQQGVTLIEVLIALLVLSIGLMGMAGLQLLGLQYTTSAYQRTQASYLAYDIMDRMRANRDTALDGNYTISYGTAPSSGTNCASLSATCSAAAMAVHDLNEWKCSLGNFDSNTVCSSTYGITGLLPSGDGSVSLNGNEFTVTIRWQDERDTSLGTTELSITGEL